MSGTRTRTGTKRRPTERALRPQSPAEPRETAPLAPAPPPHLRLPRRLRNQRQVGRALAEVTRQAVAGGLDIGKARTAIYGLSTLSGVLEVEREQTDFDARLAALEQALVVRAATPSVRPHGSAT